MTFAMLPSLYPTTRSPCATASSTLIRWTSKPASASRAGQFLVGAGIGSPVARAVRRAVATSWSSVVCIGCGPSRVAPAPPPADGGREQGGRRVPAVVSARGFDGGRGEAVAGVVVAQADGAGAVQLLAQGGALVLAPHGAAALQLGDDELDEVGHVLVLHRVAEVVAGDAGLVHPPGQLVGHRGGGSDDGGTGAADADELGDVPGGPLLLRVHLREQVDHGLAGVGLDVLEGHVGVELGHVQAGPAAVAGHRPGVADQLPVLLELGVG